MDKQEQKPNLLETVNTGSGQEENDDIELQETGRGETVDLLERRWSQGCAFSYLDCGRVNC